MMRSDTVAMPPVMRRGIDSERAGAESWILGLLREVTE